MKMRIKRYSELEKIPDFIGRYNYLKLRQAVGEETFGYSRYLNQVFYQSPEWREVRDFVILRDNGCDLGIEGFEIPRGLVLIHHMNPITEKDILEHSDFLLDPEFLISTIKRTHNAIHYGDERLLMISGLVERRPNDTIPWR